MFTVKLYRGHTAMFVQGDYIEIFPAGPACKMDDDPAKRTNDVREVSVVVEGGQEKNRVFYVSKENCWAHESQSHYVFDVAYIENERGATTEVVRPY